MLALAHEDGGGNVAELDGNSDIPDIADLAASEAAEEEAAAEERAKADEEARREEERRRRAEKSAPIALEDASPGP